MFGPWNGRKLGEIMSCRALPSHAGTGTRSEHRERVFILRESREKNQFMSAARGRKNDPAYIRILRVLFTCIVTVCLCVCVGVCVLRHLEILRKNAFDTFRCEIVLADFFCSSLFGLIRRRIFTARSRSRLRFLPACQGRVGTRSTL